MPPAVLHMSLAKTLADRLKLYVDYVEQPNSMTSASLAPFRNDTIWIGNRSDSAYKLKGELDGIETANLITKQYDIPVIYMTAHSEAVAIERAKMTEPYAYLLKPVSHKELQVAVELALYKSKTDKEKAQLTKELQAALEKVKLLSGMLPICASCKKIKKDEGYWEQVEVYVSGHSEAEFSHGLCDECGMKLYPKHWKRVMEEDK